MENNEVLNRLDVSKYGLEQLTTRYFAEVGKLFKETIDNLLMYNDMTGVESALTEMWIDELKKLSRDIPFMTDSAINHHYYCIQEAVNKGGE